MRPTLTRRLLHLAANYAVFGIAYPLANLSAASRAAGRNVMLAWDTAIPFLPWMVVPYMTSGLLFAASFLLARSDEDLRTFSRRMLFTTVTACAIFVAWPLKFSMPRPAVEPGIAAALFDVLYAVDRPYNQLPSLHVAYCLLFWWPLRRAFSSAAACATVFCWLVLVAASTVFTWQHHLVDVAGGLALGGVALALIKPAPGSAPPVPFYYLVGAAVSLLAAVTERSLLLAYLAASLALVALAYARGRAGFLRKRAGRFPLASYLLYGPYLLGYWLTWQALRLRGRGAPPFVELAPGLWVGRRLSDSEAAALPPGCAVIDLANELPETPCLRGPHYRHFALFDLAAPPPALVEQVVAEIAAQRAHGRPVYLHCAMGLSRSIFLATSYLHRYPHVPVDLPAQAALPATAPASA
jgi:membrane-associated phospholipid phosphatase